MACPEQGESREEAELCGQSSPYATSSTTAGNHLKATPSAREDSSLQAAMSFVSLPVEEAGTCGDLVHLILGGCSALRCADAVSAEQAPALASALASPAAAALEVLILSSNELGPEGIDVLSAALPRCQGLRHLDVSWNSLGPSGGEAIAQALPSMSLLQLDLSSNQLEAEGAKALAEALTMPEATITALDLSWNAIGEEGGIAIARMLPLNRRLRRLNLAINEMKAASGRAFCDALARGHPSLEELDLDGNDIPEDDMPRLP
ncbi:Nlrc5 [Symbiodinium natans]|uniref:Nlrc5 protein n=1 Tax=Symbiodinium natans TaxID=878477 RepID=A0A812LXJ7_9DINO|nr:Nlrc5 [Symbiodinium natans]